MRLFTRLLFTLLVTAMAFSAYAQTIIIGSGTTTTTSTGNDPIDGYFASFRYQVVYTAAELTTAGLPSGANITGLGWSIAGDYGGGNLLGYTIKMGHTSATNSASHDASTTTTVKNAFSYNPTVTAAGAFDMITFDVAFTWDGTSNILIDLCSSGLNAYTSPYGQVRTIASSTTNGSRYVRSDSGNQCGVNTGSTNSTKPQVSFSYTPGSGCSGTPAPGNTLSTANPACSGANFTLSLQNATSGSGVTYQWQSSPDGGSWTDIGAATSATLVTSQAASTYYRCNVTCSGNTGTSTPVQVTMEAAVNCYCSAVPSSVDLNGITNVVIGTLSNPNTSTTTYQNFTSLTAPDLQAGTSIPIAVTLGTGYTYNVRAFIDLNQDGDFADADENNYIGLSGSTNPTTQNGTVVIPAGATLGNTRMRIVATDNDTSNDPCYSGTYANVEDYTVNITAPPACVAPTALVSSNITSSGADLSWTASVSNPANGYEWKVTATNDPNAAAATSGTTGAGVTTASATGLSSATTYYYHVRSACSGVDFSGWASSTAFTTLCGELTVFSETFDGVTTPAFPTCWAKVGANGTAYTQSTSAFSASNCLYIYSGTTSTLAVVSMPPVSNANAGTHQFKLKARANFTVGGVVEIGYLTNPLDAGTFVSLSTFTTNSTTTYQDVAYAPPVTVPAGVTTFAFRHTGSPANSVLIDNVSWEALPSCIDPSALTVSGLTMTSADLSWTASASNPADGYEWKVTATNDPNATAVTSGNTAAGVTTATASGLSASTTYYAHVRAVCSVSSQSAWTSSASFTTLVCAPAAQCNFTFTKTDSYGDGWNSGVMQVKQNGTVVGTLTMTGGSSSDQTVAICEGIPFELVWSTCGSYPDEMGVVVKDLFGTTLYTLSSGSSCTANQVLYTNSNPSCTPPACVAPTAPVTSNITGSTADLAWTASSSNPSGGYEWKVTATNDPMATAEASGSTAAGVVTASASGLTSGTSHYWHVRANCGGGDYSTWVSSAVFSTLFGCPGNLGADNVNISSLPYNGTGLTNSDATNDITASNAITCGSTSYFGGLDKVYIFTPSVTATYSILLTTTTDDDAGIMLYDGCPFIGSGSTCVGQVQATTGLTRQMTPTLTGGVTYYLVVDNWTSPAYITSYSLSITLSNDDCAGAININGGGISGQPTGTPIDATTTGATASSEANTCGGVADDDVWFVFTTDVPVADATITIVPNGSFSPVIEVFNGACSALNHVDCAVQANSLTIPGAPASTTYYVRVYDFGTGFTDGDVDERSAGGFSIAFGSSPVPVELSSFTAKALAASNLIEWTTYTESNTKSHVIERSEDGVSRWNTVGVVAAKGYSQTAQSYKIEDTAPIAKAYYRLRTIDLDASEQLSKVVMVNRKNNHLGIVSVFPNPAEASISLQLNAGEEKTITVRVTDVTGRLVLQQQAGTVKGVNQLPIDIKALSAGTYFIYLVDDLQVSEPVRFIKK